MKKLYPPDGYMWSTGDGIDIENEAELRDAAIDLTDNPEFIKAMTEATKEELLKMFEQNGYEIFED